MRVRRAKQVAACVAAAIVAALTGLAPIASAAHEPRSPAELSQPSVVVRASVDRREVTTVESVTLTVEVRADASEIAGLAPEPEVGQPLGDLTVAWVRREAPVVDGTVVVHRWVVGLEPFLAGTARVPPIGVVLAGQDAPVEGVASEPIDLEVVSVLDAGEAFEPARIRAPLDPLPPEGEAGVPRWVWGLVAGGAIGALGLIGAVAARPTPEKRVRREFAPLRARAAALVNTLRDDRGRAAADAVEVLRDGAVSLLGARARALTSEELAGELTRRFAPVAGADVARVSRLLAWSDTRRYAGVAGDFPELPDLVGLVSALEAAAITEVRGEIVRTQGGLEA